MNYVYKNITVTVPQILIRGSEGGVTTIHKCQIANVDSSDATVDVYIERYNLEKTVREHGSGANDNYDDDAEDYINKSDQRIYYQIKSVVIPTGASLVLFTDHSCKHNSNFNFVIKSTQNVDVLLDYEVDLTRGTTRTINQY